MTATVTDLFCGAGGSSLGAEAAGAQLVLGMNHWRAAIDVHQANFPHADHDCTDISQADPRRYPRTDILIASPECTAHSQARGVSRRQQDPTLWDAPDPSAERSRATMWDVVRFTEQMRYEAVVVENVVEAATGWILWNTWLQAMTDLGYRHRVLSINSMHLGVPQSRDRIFVAFWRDGLTPDLELELEAWCPHCDARRTVRQAWKNGRSVGRYRQQWYWVCIRCRSVCEPATVAAETVIDWELPCPRIGDRKRPLADATRQRVFLGGMKYGWWPFLLQTAHGGRVHDVEEPHPTVCASDDRLAVVVPLRRNGDPRDVSEPIPTVTAGGTHHALVTTYHRTGAARAVAEPLTTATTRDRYALVMRNNKGGAEMSTPITEPVRTVTTKGHQSLVSRGEMRDVDRDRLIDDCGLRMFEPYEVAAAMAFPEFYIPRDLPKKVQIKLAGNAVTPPSITWPMGRLLQALEAA